MVDRLRNESLKIRLDSAASLFANRLKASEEKREEKKIIPKGNTLYSVRRV